MSFSLVRRLRSVLSKPLGAVEGWGSGTVVMRPRRLSGVAYMKFGRGVSIGQGSWIAAYDAYSGFSYSPRISIGDDVTIGRFFCLTAIDRVEIGAGCLFSEYVYISDHGHGIDPGGCDPVAQPLVSKGPTIIGERSFIGYRACVLPGVILGERCVVGANSVVTRSFPACTMLVGAPARAIKRFDSVAGMWIPAEVE